MINTFCKKKLYECTKTLSQVAMGNLPADTVIKDAKLVNVCTREIIEHTDVAIVMGRIALVGDATKCIGDNTKIIDAKGSYIAPAFNDAHIHVESSMMSLGEYAKAVIPHGTSVIYMDPHEICNVLGMKGVDCLIEESKLTPLKAMITTPSCVPAVPGFEDTGSFMGPEEIKEDMKNDTTVGLGEMMNFVGVLGGTDHAHGILSETLKADKVITGHYSLPEIANGLNAYIASGVRCCHESTREIDALEKMRRGMYALMREGSAWHDLKEVVKSITNHTVDSRYACLISDDTHPHTLTHFGHLDHIVNRAIEEGVDPITAIQMVTINPAQCFRLDNEIGSISPSKCADIVFFDNLNKLEIKKVLIDGEVVADNGKMAIEIEKYNYPDFVTHSMNILGDITPSSFEIKCERGKATVRAIEVIPAKVGNYERLIQLDVKNDLLSADGENDLLKVAVFERHHKTGTVGKGFVKGFGIKEGALAQTVAHDAHNLLVVGSNDEDMALAANTLIQCGGGLVAVKNGEILGLVELPIAGLMNDSPLAVMEEKVKKLEKAWEDMGCKMPSPFMTMALIPLACLPELRITNRGLVDCRTFNFTNLVVEE